MRSWNGSILEFSDHNGLWQSHPPSPPSTAVFGQTPYNHSIQQAHFHPSHHFSTDLTQFSHPKDEGTTLLQNIRTFNVALLGYEVAKHCGRGTLQDILSIPSSGLMKTRISLFSSHLKMGSKGYPATYLSHNVSDLMKTRRFLFSSSLRMGSKVYPETSYLSYDVSPCHNLKELHKLCCGKILRSHIRILKHHVVQKPKTQLIIWKHESIIQYITAH